MNVMRVCVQAHHPWQPLFSNLNGFNPSLSECAFCSSSHLTSAFFSSYVYVLAFLPMSVLSHPLPCIPSHLHLVSSLIIQDLFKNVHEMIQCSVYCAVAFVSHRIFKQVKEDWRRSRWIKPKWQKKKPLRPTPLHGKHSLIICSLFLQAYPHADMWEHRGENGPLNALS